jgi:long-subunit fatty acid transport protein
MKRLLLTTTCLLGAPTAYAGGLEKSGQPVTLLFEKGDQIQLDFGYVMPDVVGTDSAGTQSGNVGRDTPRFGGGIKKDFNEKWSAALIVDEPYGANFEYTPESLLFGGTSADIDSVEFTALARYKINDRFSLHGGLRVARFEGGVTLGGLAYGPLDGFELEFENDWGWGYVVGGAYEIPEIAARVALTYGSSIDFELETSENMFGDSTTELTMPQSVNLDFQMGVAPKTLFFGSARWANYDGWAIEVDGFTGLTGVPLAAKDYDIYTFKLGLGRQFTERWGGAVQATWEPGINEPLGPLNPYDGLFGLGAAASYTMPSGAKLTAGAEYYWLGDSEVVSGDSASADFTNNTAVAVAMRLSIPF